MRIVERTVKHGRNKSRGRLNEGMNNKAPHRRYTTKDQHQAPE